MTPPEVNQLYFAPGIGLIIPISTHNPLFGPNPSRVIYLKMGQYEASQCDIKRWQLMKPRRVVDVDKIPSEFRELATKVLGGPSSKQGDQPDEPIL